jgi:hypothetical protein
MPLAKATDDQTAISDATVEPWEHAAAAALELSLEIPGATRDLHRVCDELRVVCGRRLEPGLGRGLTGERRAGKQRQTDGSAKRDARAGAAGQA